MDLTRQKSKKMMQERSSEISSPLNSKNAQLPAQNGAIIPTLIVHTSPKIFRGKAKMKGGKGIN
jgi:hypothetical protein